MTSESTHTLLGSILDSAWKSAAAQAMWQSIKLGWQYFVEGEEIKPEQLWETGISIGMAALFGGAAGGWSYGAGTTLTWWQKLRIGGSTSGLQSVSTDLTNEQPVNWFNALWSAGAGGIFGQTANAGTWWETMGNIGSQAPWGDWIKNQLGDSETSAPAGAPYRRCS